MRQIIFYDSESKLFLFQESDKLYIGSKTGGLTSISISQGMDSLCEINFSVGFINELDKTVIEDALKILKVCMLNFKEKYIDEKK